MSTRWHFTRGIPVAKLKAEGMRNSGMLEDLFAYFARNGSDDAENAMNSALVTPADCGWKSIQASRVRERLVAWNEREIAGGREPLYALAYDSKALGEPAGFVRLQRVTREDYYLRAAAALKAAAQGTHKVEAPATEAPPQ